MNLREFSKKIGLPISTISKALGGYKDVNDKTRAKIILLAKKYNFERFGIQRKEFVNLWKLLWNIPK